MPIETRKFVAKFNASFAFYEKPDDIPTRWCYIIVPQKYMLKPPLHLWSYLLGMRT